MPDSLMQTVPALPLQPEDRSGIHIKKHKPQSGPVPGRMSADGSTMDSNGREQRYLIALDLDGTSVRYEPRLEMDPVVIDFLQSRANAEVRWVMNSDRFTDDMEDIASLLDSDARPAALLSCQRFIHLRDGNSGYLPVSAWNREQMQLHSRLWKQLRPFFSQWRDHIQRNFTVQHMVANDLVFACLVPRDETEALREVIRGFIAPWPEAQLSGNHEWSFILHASFSKGRLIRHCADLLGVESQRVICVGDGINDLTMLDGSVTTMVGCPANASREVKRAVAAAGGIVARAAEGRGTVAVLRHYLDRTAGFDQPPGTSAAAPHTACADSDFPAI